MRTRLCPIVDNPHIAPFIRVNIIMGKFLYIGIGQTREAAEYEDIFDDSRFIIGDLSIISLEEALNKAIQEENYELAARLRDEINRHK